MHFSVSTIQRYERILKDSLICHLFIPTIYLHQSWRALSTEREESLGSAAHRPSGKISVFFLNFLHVSAQRFHLSTGLDAALPSLTLPLSSSSAGRFPRVILGSTMAEVRSRFLKMSCVTVCSMELQEPLERTTR